MSFAESAVQSCVRGMEKGVTSSRNIRDILGCDNVDVSNIEPFLNSTSDDVRMAAISIVGAKGDMGKLVEQAKKNNDRLAHMLILDAFCERPEGIERIVTLLKSEDEVVFEEAVEMFRRVGRGDCLFGLVFHEDRKVVERVKRYINEHREETSST